MTLTAVNQLMTVMRSYLTAVINHEVKQVIAGDSDKKVAQMPPAKKVDLRQHLSCSQYSQQDLSHNYTET